MSKEPVEYLRHIAEECLYLLSVSENLSKDELLSNETLKRAVVRSLEIIGEATKKIPAEFKDTWSFIKWKNMAGMRDRLIHNYLGVIYVLVWDVMKHKIPTLYEQIQKALNATKQHLLKRCISYLLLYITQINPLTQILSSSNSFTIK